MIYMNARRLVTLAVENGILVMQDGGILIYRNAGADPQKYPKGWYLEDPECVYQEIMHDEEGQKCLKQALAAKGIPFEEINLDRKMF